MPVLDGATLKSKKMDLDACALLVDLEDEE